MELAPRSSGLAGPLALAPGGDLYLGRALLASLDPRCSRKQLVVASDPGSSGAVSVTLLGSNVSSVRPRGDSSFQPLRPGVATPLQPGSLVALLGEDYVYELRAVSAAGPPSPKRPKRDDDDETDSSAAAVEKIAGSGGGGMPWSNALSSYVRDPVRFEAAGIVVLSTADVVVVRDRYPKSKCHLLAVPRSANAPTRPSDLRRRDAAMVRAMLDALERAAMAQVAELRLSGEAARIRFGFHAAPSIRPLHMHAIGQDFSGECLKTAKHWNSFTTAFFVEASRVIAMLSDARDDAEAAAQVAHVFGDRKAAEAMFKLPLRCHRCGAELSNMPRLKAHIATCLPGVKH